MAHLEYSTVLKETGLVLDKSEAKVLCPILLRARSKEFAHIDRLQDILDSGDATERQQTQLMKHEEKHRIFHKIFLKALELAKNK